MKKFPLRPANPERVCWGCDQYCPAQSMRCGNGSERTQHPFELFGEGWFAWGEGAAADALLPTDGLRPAGPETARRVG